MIEYNNTVTQNNIQFNIYDELSGIKEYRGEINGKWILMEYDFKTNSLHHNFTETPKNTKQTLTLFVSDLVGNTNTLTTHFFR